MQENRSFDHYFGTLRGVRGFGDPRAVNLPSGKPVWYQPNGAGYVLPFHPDAPELGLQFLEDLPHGWTDTHAAWNQGKYDQWDPSKGTSTMAYLTRNDIPYHFALADAFTVCDAYHCSFLGATDPNRYHMWTGWAGNDGLGGGPVLDNSEAGYDWSTFPERLQSAGVTWKIYQDAGAGLDAPHYWGWGDNAYIGNYGDNCAAVFPPVSKRAARQPALRGGPDRHQHLAERHLFDLFRQDVRANKLPQVSWIVAPEAYTEHPNWPANYGAWYVSQMLDALTANPEVWSKTAFFLMYDENDGFFDHMVPPTPPGSRAEGLSTVDTTNEIFAGNARYARPLWPRGARPDDRDLALEQGRLGQLRGLRSHVADPVHRAALRRAASGLVEPNITPWRRAVSGDLTSAFDFKSPNAAVVSLPSTAGYVRPTTSSTPTTSPSRRRLGPCPGRNPEPGPRAPCPTN
jgi:phospholipase C